jgi:hypothetical protein
MVMFSGNDFFKRGNTNRHLDDIFFSNFSQTFCYTTFFFFLFLKLKMFTQSAAQVVNKEHRNFAANLPNPYKQKRSTHLLFCFFTVSNLLYPFFKSFPLF